MRIGSVELKLFLEKGHNDPYATERMVEVPLGRWFLTKFGNDVVEVGAVTPYYQDVTHCVIDPYDPWPRCIRNKVTDMSFDGKRVLSISTIEHVGHDEYNQPRKPEDAQRGLDLMRRALSYLVTWPVGYHKELDDYVADAKDVVRLRRTAQQEWAVAPNLNGVEFMRPWHCGNGLIIVTNCEELYAKA